MIKSLNKTLCWQITNKCTRSCYFCISKSNPNNNIGNLDVKKKIISLFDKIGVDKISISGGEPFIEPNIETLVKSIIEKNIKCQITTNADIFLNKGIPKWLLEEKIPLIFSLYGGEVEHNEVMKHNHFSKVINLAKKIPREMISINILITKESLNYIYKNAKFIYNTFSRLLLIEEVNSQRKETVKIDLEQIHLLFENLNKKDKKDFKFFYHDYRKNVLFPVLTTEGDFTITSNKGIIKIGSIFSKNIRLDDDLYTPKEFLLKLWKKQYNNSQMKVINYE